MSSSMNSVVIGFLCILFVLNGHGIWITMADAKTSSRVHIIYLGERQHDNPKFVTDSHHDLLATTLGSKSLASESMVYSYKHGFSGFAAKLTEAQAREIAKLPGVVRVIPNTIHKLQTTRSWDYLGLSPQLPSNNILQNSNMGDGVIIGVLDTGIWPESKSFSDEGLGPVPSHWKGVCVSGENFKATLHCNKKIIGARWFNDGILAEYGLPLNSSETPDFMSTRDAHGHGTHTASTAAGSFVTNVSYKGLAHGTIRGGAPNARLAIYKVCWLGGQCSDADILKAFDEAIHDGVDVLSLSLGSSIPLFSEVDQHDGIATGSFHAVAKGITVVCAAGNGAPAAQTVANTSPWIITVAASTIDRAFPTAITLGNNKTFLGQAIYTGPLIGFTSLMYPEADEHDLNASSECQSVSLNRSMVSGKVVLCFTSLTGSVVVRASSAVKKAGGVGVIIAKNPNDLSSPCSDDFPCIEVDYEIGTRILFYTRSTRNPLVQLNPSKTLVGKPLSAKVAYFSERGPNSIAPAVLKPDVAAPGVNILASIPPPDLIGESGYAMKSGTSMATPHVSGIVALIKAVHPNWSPAAIRSALVTTASRNGPSGLPIFAEGTPQKLANPFDFGGGIVNANGAADPGLVYDMGAADYMHYLCAMGYNNSAISRLSGQTTTCPIKRPSILDINLPSITIPSLRNSITVIRTVTNVGSSKSVYEVTVEPPLGTVVSVKPNSLVFNSTVDKLAFEVTISTTHQMNTGYYFGSLTWTDKVHAVRIPLSVRTEFLQNYADDY